jgi:acyl carrier protein
VADPTALGDRIATLFQTALSLTVPSVETDLFETGILDSLSFVTFLVHLEEAFGFHASVDDLEFDNFRSISRIAAFLAARQGAPGAAVA